MSYETIRKLKKTILRVSYTAKDGHLGSSFSILDILFVLYDRVLNLTADTINDDSRDYMILSKGHASLAHAAILEEKGFINKNQLMSFCSHDSILGGHLDKNKVQGVEASTGSLGHGISISIGIALASKIKRQTNKVYVVVGDGECNEGTFWESMLLGAHHKLDNLYCIVDYNRSNDRALQLDPLQDKLRAFGWDVIVINGHSHDEIYNSLNYYSFGKPVAVIARTIKGKGIKEMEGNHAWHHKYPSKEELDRMIKELS